MTEAKFKEVLAQALEQNNALLFGQLVGYLDERLRQAEARSEAKLDAIQVSIDKLAARVSDDEAERSAITAQQDRHEEWIQKLAESTGTSLAATD